MTTKQAELYQLIDALNSDGQVRTDSELNELAEGTFGCVIPSDEFNEVISELREMGKVKRLQNSDGASYLVKW